jgi:WD40 repeat protein
MKKLVLTFSVVLIFHSFITADLIDVYKKGEITIIPDPEFGTNTNWDVLFRDVDQWFAFLPDGSFFRSCSKNNKVYKFDEQGNLLFEFGQYGQGPGDLNAPGDLSILDEKYLVVNEYALSRRISIFDLDGKFVKLLKINYNANSCISLKNNKIAIVSESSGPGERKVTKSRVDNIFIKNIWTEKEINVASFTQEIMRSKLTPVHYYGRAYISKIDSDKLLVAFTGNPEINIYSLNGEKLFSFKLNLERKEVKKSDIDHLLGKTIENEKTNQGKELMRQFIKMNRDKMSFPKSFPYYYKVAVDSEDNILVFLNTWIDDSAVTFQVYSKDGQYVCTTKMNSGNFEVVYPTIFYKNYIYSRLRRKGSDDSSYLSRIKLN